MHYFYSKNIHDNLIALSKEEAHHALRVMRLKEGDEVGVFDGEGSIFKCKIAELSKSKCILNIKSHVTSQRSPSNLSILIAPTKNNDRLEWFLEKATEIGVHEIVPILCDHSERKKIRKDRLEKVLISAMKQSMNPFLPKLKELKKFNEVIDDYSSFDRFISHCGEGDKHNLFEMIKPNVPCAIFIGPEGDFSVNEIKEAKKFGWNEVSLGHQRFRTETAGIVAVHMHSLKSE